MRLCRLVTFAVLMLSQLGAAAAQEWPTRHITAIVPFGPGNSVDIVGRLLVARMSELLGQQIIVENVGGAGGSIGTARAARAAPDGYTIVIGGADTFAQNQSLFEKPPYNPATDFVPIVLAVGLPLVLVGRNGLPPSNLQELIPCMKANQDKMQFGSASAGSATHLGCALLNAAIGVNVTHIPYRGGAPAMQDLVAGWIDYLCIDTPIAIPLIEGGQIKALAILTRTRSASLPDLASAQEQGLANFEAANWAAFFMPKGTPEPIVSKLAAASATATGSAAVQKRMKEIGVDPVAPERRTPEYLATFVEGEIAKWAGPVKASGLATD